LTSFPNALQRPEDENAILYDWPSQVRARVPAQQKRGAPARDIGGIERVIAVEDGDEPAPLAGPTLTHDVHDSSRRTAEGVLSLYPHGLGGLSAWPWRSTSSAGSVRAGHNSPHEEAMSTDP